MTLSTEVVEQRARDTKGTSGNSIYRMVVNEIRNRSAGGTIYDIGCGAGLFRSFVTQIESVKEYVGVDIVRYDTFPADARFLAVPLDRLPWPIDDGVSDITCCIETIEHLENPRALFRELTRITRPGGLIIVTTPNQTSFLSKLTLLLKNQYNEFQERPGLYPPHITALLPIDLRRIAAESGLKAIDIKYSQSGRIPGLKFTWPVKLGLCGAPFSDNVLCSSTR